jgi:beta-glucanase (GH16 family)
MKLFAHVIVVLAFAAGSALADWQLIWADEFNGAALNTSEWTFQTGCNGWGNNELECYTDNRRENARVEAGHLVIDVVVEEFQGHHFTSSRMNSRKAWTYGKFEARAKAPAGHHLWPAIWMMPKDSKYGVWAASGEIDIMEMRGDAPRVTMGTIHYGGSWPNNVYHGSGEKTYAFDFSADFHTFGLEWTKNDIKWFVDGNLMHTENINKMMWSGKGNNPYNHNGAPFDAPFYWILNIAVGGNFFGGGPYVTPAEARGWMKPTMEVDYVRVYEWK